MRGNKKKKEISIQPRVTEFLREAEKEISESSEEVKIEIPDQPEFFKTPVRFGSIPVDKLPRGCDEKQQYKKKYPKISLPFQQVEKISFGHPDLEPNRLIFGDNLHVMRMLPSNSIDLIYLDPPFFSGRNYNVIFGDQNEVRSFTDIWEGGMPGYLIWLNARLLEMKRLLKPTGSIFLHLDWHASHYVKCELDKIFGYENFINEIIWNYETYQGNVKRYFARKHDVILWYSKGNNYTFHQQHLDDYEDSINYQRWEKYIVEGNKIKGNYYPKTDSRFMQRYNKWVRVNKREPGPDDVIFEIKSFAVSTCWKDIKAVDPKDKSERIGYPTQKPELLLIRIIESSSNEGDVVADFFCGGGTTPVVAQNLGRRWIGCDISRIAISVTRDRLLRVILSNDKKAIQQSLEKVPDISIEHWGVYEVPKLVELSNESFRNFVISAFNGRLSTEEGLIHGYKGGIPIFVGPSSQETAVTKNDVVAFAKEIVTKKSKHQGTMIAWAFAPSAQEAAHKLAAAHAASIDFVKLELIPVESDKFSEHITSKHPEYRNLLKFILPPEVRVSTKRVDSLENFDLPPLFEEDS